MTAASLNREMIAALVDELGVVVGGMIDSSATVAAGTPAPGRQWVAEIVAEGALAGVMTVALDHSGATAMTRLLTGIEGDIPDEALLDTLKEVLAQAVSAFALKPVARGARLTVLAVTPADSHAAEGESSAFDINSDKLPVPLAVTASASVTPVQSNTASAGQTSKGNNAAGAATADGVFDDRFDVILDIDLPLVVRFGRTELPLRALTRLGPGSVIDLGRSPDDPVDVLVSNRVVARGEVVVVSGSYGIRILDVVSQRERVRSMEA